MPRITDDEQTALLNHALLGNAAAINFCEAVFGISQVWDDLIDRDVVVDNETINMVFWDALITLPNNPFYRAHILTLTPLLQAAIVDWMDANTLEGHGIHQKQCAFVLRDSLVGIVIHCAFLVGGWEHMRAISVEVRSTLYDETQDEYLEGLA